MKELFLPIQHVGFAGLFSWELVHARTELVARRGTWQPNLVTNAGLDRFGVSGNWRDMLAFLAVGTGSNAPTNGDVTLQNEIARTNSDGGITEQAGTASGNEYHWLRRCRLFTESQANGNLTELGWFEASTGGSTFIRSLFKDQVGSPTTITKTNEYQLRVFYEFRVYPQLSDVPHEATINGSAMDVDYRVFGVGSYNLAGGSGGISWGTGAARLGVRESQTLVAVTQDDPGSVSWITGSVAGYSNGNYYRDVSGSFGATVGNFATGIGMILGGRQPGTTFGYGYQLSLASKVSKSNLQRFDVTTRISWNRHTI